MIAVNFCMFFIEKRIQEQNTRTLREHKEMLRTITRLLFGREEEATEVVKSGDVVEEDWLLVGHQVAVTDVSPAEDQGAEQVSIQHSNSAPDGHSKVDPGISMLDQESTVGSNNTSSQTLAALLSHTAATAKMTQLTSIQKAKAWADRHHMSRNVIQRRNRVCREVHHHSFQLQQPGHRSLSH
ncbi:tumor protein p53-inducible nuclear protein 2 [Thalassophryne amazonica]|uniref:tumor protein p53-inducible nuclear protein 2 n=1 Tax=Thalassophryne amazonica TaxID=390379 RepID=UPI0014714EDB|nr:tumor protein p53-inducible nuclear protein 2 [Thalassophryne amazonica]